MSIGSPWEYLTGATARKTMSLVVGALSGLGIPLSGYMSEYYSLNMSTALHAACVYGHLQLVKILILNGSDITSDFICSHASASERGKVSIEEILGERRREVEANLITNDIFFSWCHLSKDFANNVYNWLVANHYKVWIDHIRTNHHSDNEIRERILGSRLFYELMQAQEMGKTLILSC